MSIALPVHVPGPTYTPRSTIAGHLLSRATVHLLHNAHKSIGLYEIQDSGEVRKVQEFLSKGTTSIHLIPGGGRNDLDAFVLVGDLVDWYSIQQKGADAAHDFVCLESPEELMRFCRTVPYTFVCFDPDTQELVETRRSYFAEDQTPSILTHHLPDGQVVCIIGTSNGLLGVMSIDSDTPDFYYKVRGSQNSTYRYVSLSQDHLAVQVELNGQSCLYFFHLEPSGTITLASTLVPKQPPLGVGPVPSSVKRSVVCVWYKHSVEFMDPTFPGGPRLLSMMNLPLPLSNIEHAVALSEPEVELYTASKWIVRVKDVGHLEFVETVPMGVQVGDGSLYTCDGDLVQLRKFSDTIKSGWAVRTISSGDHPSTRADCETHRVQFPFSYELITISCRGCESSRKEFSSWSHHFDKSLGSSFLTVKNSANYAACRKSGLCADKIEDVIQLWLHNEVIIVTTNSETMAFRYDGSPRLNLVRIPLGSGISPARTFAFKNGIQVTGAHVHDSNCGISFTIPSQCRPITDATCFDESKVVVASGFSTFAVVRGLVTAEKRYNEPVMKVIAADGVIATMTLQNVYIEKATECQTFKFSNRLCDVVVTGGHVVVATFDGDVYIDRELICSARVDNVPIKLIVAGNKVLAVTQVDAMIIDVLSRCAHSAVALSGCNGGFSADQESFAVLKNGSMWVCDLSEMATDLQRTSRVFIGPIKIDSSVAPQWSWSEKLMCINTITSARFSHEITDVCPVHPLQTDFLQGFEGLIASMEPKAYISCFETLYIWADFQDFDLFKRLINIQKRLETREHTFGGHKEPKWLEWYGFVDGEMLSVALQNPSIEWLFREEGVDPAELRTAFQLMNY